LADLEPEAFLLVGVRIFGMRVGGSHFVSELILSQWCGGEVLAGAGKQQIPRFARNDKTIFGMTIELRNEIRISEQQLGY
jgi:hypothetical protein